MSDLIETDQLPYREAGREMRVLGIVFVPLGIALSVMGGILGFRSGDLLLLLGFSAPGLPFLVMGLWYLFSGSRAEKELQQVMEKAFYVEGVIDGIEEDLQVRKKLRPQYYVKCSFVDSDGNVRRFTSRNLPEKPEEALVGWPIRIYVEPEDYSVSYVDIDRALQEYGKFIAEQDKEPVQ